MSTRLGVTAEPYSNCKPYEHRMTVDLTVFGDNSESATTPIYVLKDICEDHPPRLGLPGLQLLRLIVDTERKCLVKSVRAAVRRYPVEATETSSA